MSYLYLAGSIVFEVIGTNLLKKTNGFSHIPFTGATLLAYGMSFYCLSITVKTIPLGIVYATWSGAGIVLVALISYFFFKEKLDLAAIVGMTLIISGVMIMNLLSKSASH